MRRGLPSAEIQQVQHRTGGQTPMMLLQGPSDGATPDYGICVAPTWQQMLAARTGERRRLALPLLAVRNFEKRRGNTKLPDPSFLKEAVNDGAVHYYAGRAQWFSLRPRDPSLLDQLEELELVDHSSSIAFGDSLNLWVPKTRSTAMTRPFAST